MTEPEDVFPAEEVIKHLDAWDAAAEEVKDIPDLTPAEREAVRVVRFGRLCEKIREGYV